MVTDENQLLEAIPFAARLTPVSLEKLRGNGRRLSLPPRTTLLQPGDAVSGAYFVISGSIRIYYLDANGEAGTLYRVEAGGSCILALNCLFSKMQYPAWAEAGEEGVTFLAIDGTLARELIGHDPTFTQLLFEQISLRLFQILTVLEAAIRLPLEGRLVTFLLETETDGVVALSQERIAEHLGTSREVVSRIIRKHAKGGLLSLSYGRIQILDREKLSAILQDLG